MALEQAAFPPVDHFPRRAWRRLLTVDSSLVLMAFLPPSSPPMAAGCIAWLTRSNATVARMYSLAVHPEARGRGLARQLVAASLRHLPRRFTTLSLEVRSGNVPALRLYESLGFVVCGHLMGYYPDGGDGLRMRAPRAAVAAALAG